MPGLEFRPTQPSAEADENNEETRLGRQQEQEQQRDSSANSRQKRPRSAKSSYEAPVPAIMVPDHTFAAKSRQGKNSNSTSATNTTPTENNLLLNLSEACKKHSLWHKAASLDGTITAGDILIRCKSDLATLRKILPRVERKINSSASSKSSFKKAGGPDPAEAAQLSHFYRDVLSGGYCPQAPQLFKIHDGELPDCQEVFLRVHSLLQQLASPRLVADAKLGAASDRAHSNKSPVKLTDEDTYKACHRPVLTIWVVEKAVSHFLFTLVDENSNLSSSSNQQQRRRPWKQIQKHVNALKSDFIQTMMDLAILSQYLAYFPTTSENPVLKYDEDDKMQIFLFPKTIASLMTELQLYNSSQTTASTTTCAQEYLLDVAMREDTVFMLQSSVLNILIRWNTMLNTSRLKCVPIPTDGLMQSQPSTKTPSNNTFENTYDQFPLEQASSRDLLASLRPMFTSSSVSVLAERARSAALEMIITTDLVYPSRIGSGMNAFGDDGMDLSLLLELALLTVCAIGGVLLRNQQWQSYGPDASGNESVPTQADDVLHNLALLLRRTVIFPPLVRGYTSKQLLPIIRQAVLIPLLEGCLPWIRAVHASIAAPKSKIRQLQDFTLRTIHTCLLTRSDPALGFSLAAHTDPVSIVGPLLDLLGDAELSSCSLLILSALLKPLNLGVQRMCSWCWSHQNDAGLPQVRAAKIPPVPPAYPEDLPKAISNSIHEQLFTQNESAAASGGDKKKTKRRASLLQKSPLKIQSPVAKRRRHQNAFTFSPPSTDSQPKSSTDHFFVEDVLQEYFIKGLQAAQNISEWRSSEEMGSIQNPRDFLTDANVLSGCTRLLVCLLRCRDNDNGTDEDIIRSSSYLVKLAENWRSLSATIHKQASMAVGIASDKKDETHWNIHWQQLADITVNCGLFYFEHLCHKRIFEVHSSDAIFRQTWSNVNNALVLVARWTPESSLIDKRCNGACNDILGTISSFCAPEKSCKGPLLCLCELMHGTYQKSADTEKDFASDCAIMTFMALPLSIRCCLLEALASQRWEYSKEIDKTALNLHPSLTSAPRQGSIFAALLKTKPLVWSTTSLAALVLAPLEMVASCISPGDVEVRRKGKQQLGIVLSDFLRSIVCPAIGSIQEQNIEWRGRLRNSLLVTIRQIQFLHLAIEDDTPVDLLWGARNHALFNLSFVLKFFRQALKMDSFQVRKQDSIIPNRGAHDCLRREVTFRLSRAVDVNWDGQRHLATSTPYQRLLKWKCVAWECLRLSDPVSLSETAMWLIEFPFSDDSEFVREYTSKRIGLVLLENNGYGLFALFSPEDENSFGLLSTNSDPYASTLEEKCYFSIDDADVQKRERFLSSQNRVVVAFFTEFDRLLKCYCDDEIHFSSSIANQMNKKEQVQKRLRKMSAIRVLSSLCRHAPTERYYGKRIFELAMIRLSKWLCHGEKIDRDTIFLIHKSVSGASFGELTRISRACHLGQLIAQRSCFVSLLADLIRNSFVGSVRLQHIDNTTPADREDRFSWLFSILRVFIEASMTKRLAFLKAYDVVKFLHTITPILLAEMVVAKDYDSLRLFAGFKLFLQEDKNEDDKASKKRRSNARLLDSEMFSGPAIEKRVARGALYTTKELEKQTEALCSNVMEQMLPTIFMKSQQTQLEFFSTVVLQSDFQSLRQRMVRSDQSALKALILNLGDDPDMTGQARLALRAAALVKSQDFGKKSRTSRGLKGGMDSDPTDHQGLVAKWVTSKFLFLMVNLIQFGWKTKSDEAKLQTLRCFNGMLACLQAKQAPQFFPLILASVNTAIEEASGQQRIDSLRMQVLAVQALSKFCRIVAEVDSQTLGQQLTGVVVSLIPVLSEDDDSDCNGRTDSLKNDSAKIATDLLEWLTSGELGKTTAAYFAAIPFLPVSVRLDGVRSNLRTNGVNFDNLLVATQGTQLQASRETRSDGGSTTSLDGKSREATQQAALARRINTVCTLLGHENVSTRKVILKHLTDLLRSNRTLFYSLIQNGGTTPTGRFLTVDYQSSGNASKGLSSFSITELMGILLAQCVHETEAATRELLGTCLGEIGAINGHRLGAIIMSEVLVASDPLASNDSGWRLSQPPWKSQPTRYMLQLVTRHLVLAMKAAPTSGDQHKIQFAVQQILQLLDRSAQETTSQRNNAVSEMSNWLKDQLKKAGVLDDVEPFFKSKFGEKAESANTKEPPFYQSANSYRQWLSDFTRYFIMRAHRRGSPWANLFHALRTAVRTPVGLGVAEFILPVLILDRLCFGSSMEDYQAILHELRDVFAHKTEKGTASMSPSDRRKCVNCCFSIVETLEHWAEVERQQRQKLTLPTQRSQAGLTQGLTETWTADDCIFRIDNIVNQLPLRLRAKAAASIGMRARSLRALEMAARQGVVGKVFNSTSNDATKDISKYRGGTSRASGIYSLSGADCNLMKDILADLNNYETMAALDEVHSSNTKPEERTMESIRQNEAAGNWEGALRDYERAQQLRGCAGEDSEFKLKLGALRSLLHLGQFDSVLNQVNGISHSLPGEEWSDEHRLQLVKAKSLAIEAAWKLGRWNALSKIMDDVDQQFVDKNIGVDGRYQVAQGRAMLGIHSKTPITVAKAVQTARRAVMESLSRVARESYGRAYNEIVKLQCLREIEDASVLLCSRDASNPMTFLELTKSEGSDGWAWDRRLEMTGNAGAVVETRLGLARLAKDSMFEGILFLSRGTRARKNGQFNIAADAFAQCETIFDSIMSDAKGGKNDEVAGLLGTTRMELAKMMHESGQSTAALKLLGHDDIQRVVDVGSDTATAKKLVLEMEVPSVQQSEDIIIQRFADRVLQSTEWIVEGGLKDGGEIIKRFEIVNKLAPKMEKGHLQFSKYLDSIVQSRAFALAKSQPQTIEKASTSLAESIIRDGACQKYILLAMKQYSQTLQLSSAPLIVAQALPRLLSLWFELLSIQIPFIEGTGAEETSSRRRKSSSGMSKAQLLEKFKNTQSQAVQEMRACANEISAAALYTAIPQLVAQILHVEKETSSLVQGILTKVLKRIPHVAMWPLAWLLHSKNVKRQNLGKRIFLGAQKYFSDQKSHSSQKWGTIIKAAESLIAHLHFLAQEQPKQHKRTISVQPWKGEVELIDFTPPIQEALTSVYSLSGGDRDMFPRGVPKIRALSSQIQVMASKARPKKITAFVVPASKVSMIRKQSSLSTHDIGEIHFLAKQEAKGDLRKDARVQDLNTVINRSMASSRDSGKYGQSSQHRQLRLRTFAVTCLSEETGILEWVPETSSLRNLISVTYNPQADQFSKRRRGSCCTDFSDPSMRAAYEDKCQDQYFKHGNLTRAGELFEELMLKEYPPVFFWWFVQQFRDPHAWYEARTLWTMSVAIWSGVGHVLGLGDRHSENILVDTSSGECVHVDFDCIFDKGQNLPKPEVVPFRLTSNIVDAFGPTGVDGVFTESLKLTMRTLRDNRDTMLSVLEPFINDPIIDWKRTRSAQSPKKSSFGHSEMSQVQDRETKAAKLSIKVLDGRLRGIYNLRNPNARKIRRTDGVSTDRNGELTQSIPLSVEGQVHKMIAEATSSENLVQLYVGWMPWV